MSDHSQHPINGPTVMTPGEGPNQQQYRQPADNQPWLQPQQMTSPQQQSYQPAQLPIHQMSNAPQQQPQPVQQPAQQMQPSAYPVQPQHAAYAQQVQSQPMRQYAQPLPHAPQSPQQSVVGEQLTVSPGLDSIPPGNYTARFVDYVALTMTSQFSDGPQEKRKLVFEVVGGPFAGKKVDVLANATFSPKSTLFKWAVTLLGRQLQVGEHFSFGQLIGREFSIIVQLNEKGFSKLITAVPLSPQP